MIWWSRFKPRECKLCGEEKILSARLGVCADCIKENPEALKIVAEVRKKSRERFGLPPEPPRDPNGIACNGCANACVIGEGKKGFCGLVKNVGGKLVRVGGTPEAGVLEWYYDPLPTNCVAWWVCAGCTGAGYPKYSYSKAGPERGYANLAVFYGACSYDCLYCQNWHYRELAMRGYPRLSAKSLASYADAHVTCICYFGGDPSPQMPHALETSKLALRKAKEEGRILRICWETNGNMRREHLIEAAELSLKSGGTVKFDLKFFDENLNKAICGVSNRATLANFRFVGEEYYRERPDPPLLVASTLLVPGYVDEDEVRQLASFIADIDPTIPYTLLAFYPQYVMDDLPTTSKKHAERCVRAAKEEGLERVRLANVHLLSNAYE